MAHLKGCNHSVRALRLEGSLIANNDNGSDIQFVVCLIDSADAVLHGTCPPHRETQLIMWQLELPELKQSTAGLTTD